MNPLSVGPNEAIQVCVRHFTSINGMARAMGVSNQAAAMWVRNQRIPVAPINRVQQLVRLTQGRVTPHQLRPDIYGPADSGPEPAAQRTG